MKAGQGGRDAQALAAEKKEAKAKFDGPEPKLEKGQKSRNEKKEETTLLNLGRKPEGTSIDRKSCSRENKLGCLGREGFWG